MSDRPTCVDCGEFAPETNTNYTLISTGFGWRLTRRQLANGEKVAEWRCATCWRAHKGPAPSGAPARRQTGGGSGGGPR